VRFTGDCPLIDPEIVGRLIALHLQGAFDYTSLTKPPTFPDGLDAEIVRYSVLEEAWQKAILPSHREHVMPYIYQETSKFVLGNLRNVVDLSRLRWTVDEIEDFEFVSRVYQELYPSNKNFNMDDILCLLKKYPEIMGVNAKFTRNEGLNKSLERDAAFMKIGGEK